MSHDLNKINSAAEPYPAYVTTFIILETTWTIKSKLGRNIIYTYDITNRKINLEFHI